MSIFYHHPSYSTQVTMAYLLSTSTTLRSTMVTCNSANIQIIVQSINEQCYSSTVDINLCPSLRCLPDLVVSQGGRSAVAVQNQIHFLFTIESRPEIALTIVHYKGANVHLSDVLLSSAPCAQLSLACVIFLCEVLSAIP